MVCLKLVCPPRTPNNSIVMEERKDENDKVISREPFKSHEYVMQDATKVQGYPLKRYMPKMNTTSTIPEMEL